MQEAVQSDVKVALQHQSYGADAGPCISMANRSHAAWPEHRSQCCLCESAQHFFCIVVDLRHEYTMRPGDLEFAGDMAHVY